MVAARAEPARQLEACHRSAEQETLAVRAAQAAQLGQLGACLDALGDRAQPERVRQLDDGTHEGRVGRRLIERALEPVFLPNVGEQFMADGPTHAIENDEQHSIARLEEIVKTMKTVQINAA